MVHPLTLTAGARDEQEEKVSITRRRMKRCSILIIVFECAENMQKRWKSIDYRLISRKRQECENPPGVYFSMAVVRFYGTKVFSF